MIELAGPLATVRNMREFQSQGPIIAWSPVTDEQCSADPRDYWHLSEDDHLVDEAGEPMVLMRYVPAHVAAVVS
jgi:hypothetical protein